MPTDLNWMSVLLLAALVYLIGISRYFLWWAVRGQSRFEYWTLGFLFDKSRSVPWRITVFLLEIVAVMFVALVLLLLTGTARSAVGTG